MIESFADLLDQLKQKEQQLLKNYDIVKHPGIIGDMYEGLSKDILDKALFKGLGLKVAAGKIKSGNGKLSAEIDAMIVTGDGESIPYTDKFIYPVENVIAVIQVKKNLHSSEVASSYENLRTIIDITDHLPVGDVHRRMHEDAYSLICQRRLPPSREELEKESTFFQLMYHTLFLEAVYPARIVWAYNGFTSEYKLRESFTAYLSDNLTTDPNNRKFGYGPLNFPNLLICDQFSLVKSNGIPFGTPIFDDEWWPLYFSTNKTPLLYLLEIIWTRLQYLYTLSPHIFGEDLSMDTGHLFILGTVKQKFGKNGWEYKIPPFTSKELKEPLQSKEWEPAFLEEEEFIIINTLATVEEINYETDHEFLNFIKQYPRDLSTILANLKETGLVAVENGKLTLLTEACLSGVTSDGKYFAGENKTGRVTRWMNKTLFPKSTD